MRERWCRERPAAWLPLLAVDVPPVLVGVAVGRYGIRVPDLDAWALVPLPQAAEEGSLSARHFWTLHNEHRIVAPKLIFVTLARATAWDSCYELAASFLIALPLLGVLVVLSRRTVHQVAPSLTPWLILFASMMTFSLARWENWSWGWQLQVFLVALAAAVTVLALSGEMRSPVAGLFAFAAAACGDFSFAAGLVLLGLVPLGLLLRQWSRGARVGALSVFVAIAATAGTAGAYMVGFHHPPYQPPTSFLFSHPLEYLA